MSSQTAQRWYTIKEAAAFTGLPASTLRYYESIGVIAPVSRGATSKHRAYNDEDLDDILWVACLAATGLTVKQMQHYVANGHRGAEAAAELAEMLEAQRARLQRESELLTVRQKYVDLKIGYWRAIEAGDEDQAELLGVEARSLADQLKRIPNNH